MIIQAGLRTRSIFISSLSSSLSSASFTSSSSVCFTSSSSEFSFLRVQVGVRVPKIYHVFIKFRNKAIDLALAGLQ